ncbi:hypothetical protein [Thalassoroseus pseudoceratinae]|uniref:hypothetical protein n=1 Tax=Thalassoroseus pseudoceratinae TaxID=2713176 RepID=UPI00141F115E|nr:hypothetical protein [Thalassoroseus pseudoceratinae]
MSTQIQKFLDQRPLFTQCHAVDRDADFAIHLGVWRRSEFPDLNAFVAFVFRYSSVLQPYIAEPDRRDLASWFHPDSNAEESAASYMTNASPLSTNARDWLAKHAATVDGGFLDSSSIDTVIVDNDSMYIQTTEWYIHSFVADLLDAPEPFPQLDGHENEEPWSEDRNFYEFLGPESDSVSCKRDVCDRGRVKHSVFCRPHHFENVKGRPSPYTH